MILVRGKRGEIPVLLAVTIFLGNSVSSFQRSCPFKHRFFSSAGALHPLRLALFQLASPMELRQFGQGSQLDLLKKKPIVSLPLYL